MVIAKNKFVFWAYWIKFSDPPLQADFTLGFWRYCMWYKYARKGGFESLSHR